MKLLHATVLALAAGAAVALAGNTADANGPGKTAPFRWTGFYVGGQVGVVMVDDAFGDADQRTFGSLDAHGGVVGGHLGYNYQAGLVVVGLEADVEWSNASGSGRSFSVLGPALGSGDADLNWQGSVRGRLGWAYGPTLFYATAGVVWGNFDLGFTAIDRHGFSETLTGWTVGGGVETALLGKWTGRIEYRFTDYGDATRPFLVAPGVFHHQRHELESHSLRMGLSYKF